ncbi:DUF881 domain-containing protein [Aeromicrobium panaciterrae]|uniref:DUF881 domain-containing protein n=1 Tax=Aeromicrobium panaciterrae TaxID=363861 RepID=UPI0031D19649
MAKAGRHERQSWTFAVLAICVIAGFLFVAASVNADGTDLRPAGGDVGSLLKERSDRIADRRDDARKLRKDIDALSAEVSGAALDDYRKKATKLEQPTGLTALDGPGIRVTLTDAPKSVKPEDVADNLLVVHQQDIQAFVNALWAGGAEAISIQGQRLISTTGIKCVGNTVVLDGVPYSPPYVIEAIGDGTRMNEEISRSPETTSYRLYVQVYKLGLEIETVDDITIKAYSGPVSLRYARAQS